MLMSQLESWRAGRSRAATLDDWGCLIGLAARSGEEPGQGVQLWAVAEVKGAVYSLQRSP